MCFETARGVQFASRYHRRRDTPRISAPITATVTTHPTNSRISGEASSVPFVFGIGEKHYSVRGPYLELRNDQPTTGDFRPLDQVAGIENTGGFADGLHILPSQNSFVIGISQVDFSF